jgi:hypothetical protein
MLGVNSNPTRFIILWIQFNIPFLVGDFVWVYKVKVFFADVQESLLLLYLTDQERIQGISGCIGNKA